MPQFHVRLIGNIAVAGAIMSDGTFGRLVKFNITRLADGKKYIYEGRGFCELFARRCDQMSLGDGAVIEAEESASGEADTLWKEKLVNLALEKTLG